MVWIVLGGIALIVIVLSPLAAGFVVGMWQERAHLRAIRRANKGCSPIESSNLDYDIGVAERRLTWEEVEKQRGDGFGFAGGKAPALSRSSQEAKSTCTPNAYYGDWGLANSCWHPPSYWLELERRRREGDSH